MIDEILQLRGGSNMGLAVGNTIYKRRSCIMKTYDAIHTDKMNFTVTNIRPDTAAKEKSEIETTLFNIFKKYAV